QVQVRSVRSTESNGSSGWDAAGGLPDLFVCVEPVNGSLGGSAACTPACADSSSCAYNESEGDLGVFPGASVQAGLIFTVYDEDVDPDDLVASGTFTLTDVAAGGYSSGAFG